MSLVRVVYVGLCAIVDDNDWMNVDQSNWLNESHVTFLSMLSIMFTLRVQGVAM